MTKTAYGFLHGHYGPDMDGSSRTFEWIADEAPEDLPGTTAGWWAFCQIEPEAGWVGPFETEVEAISTATSEEAFNAWQYGDDPMGDWMGENV